jgi:hypothetical protein
MPLRTICFTAVFSAYNLDDRFVILFRIRGTWKYPDNVSTSPWPMTNGHHFIAITFFPELTATK